MEDRELIRRMQNDESEAWLALSARHQSWVFERARRRVKDLHGAEDVTQSVFLDAYNERSCLDPDSSIIPWLGSTTDGYVREVLSSMQGVSFGALIDPANVLGPPEWESLFPQIATSHADFLRSGEWDPLFSMVSNYDSNLLRSFHLEGQSVDEIATTLGKKPGLVDSDLISARDNLRSEVKTNGYF